MVVAALLALAGCDGGEGDALAGTSWGLDQGLYCAGGASFDRSHGYKIFHGCQLTDGSIGLNEEVGTYAIDGDHLSTYVHATTCPTENDSVLFTVTANNLTIQTPAAIIVFARSHAPPPDTSGLARFGCYDDAGAFTPSPLVSL